MEIKVANEAKQDITIGKADEILGKINNQQITARCVKSVQRGYHAEEAKDRKSYSRSMKIVPISSVNSEKSSLNISYLYYENASSRGEIPIATNVKNPRVVLKNDGIYINSNNLDYEYDSINIKAFTWEVVEFY